jgi:hypothetical protein
LSVYSCCSNYSKFSSMSLTAVFSTHRGRCLQRSCKVWAFVGRSSFCVRGEGWAVFGLGSKKRFACYELRNSEAFRCCLTLLFLRLGVVILHFGLKKLSFSFISLYVSNWSLPNNYVKSVEKETILAPVSLLFRLISLPKLNSR